MLSPQEHFTKLDAIFQRYAAALASEVCDLQKSDETQSRQPQDRFTPAAYYN
ncbi:hypothetical protein [Aerosakkonema funiforme]|uniref:Uncharacterized protein n=1 Tax=Aerosakkonema funiforme FACHB-1375 TaxID=2949571 RepID=A0A926ZL21_9CYAN|nr:hypothetical protein [Aerosakkonema funiforme]MBD2186279.1 hypothetical protein [Aerosakkonema funiforme FACHB-1375]